ncbi:Fur family transcriptional regulator [uncultured Anaerococcus sp.]|uniref:Fur family transcriptional regulator n=1 Tax=uncultured Anaerococcus sp. TaxID=293428 RepID=UPI0025D96335|nr:Fur family transcriptional regulator [uncultured Anaerococcus sp.]
MNLNDLLRDKNLRITKQRRLILEYIDKKNEPVSGQEIYLDLQDKMAMDLSTVYRNLNILEENDLLLKTADIDGISYYQINKDDHKHFITCNNCGKKLVIESCPVHELEEEAMKETGFIINGHNFEFYGICPDCQRKLAND